MLCLYLQIVYFPGQYQLSKQRGRRVGIGIEVRIAVRWGGGGKGHREEHQFQHVVLANLLVFSSLVVSSSVSLSTLNSSCFISHSVKV